MRRISLHLEVAGILAATLLLAAACGGAIPAGSASAAASAVPTLSVAPTTPRVTPESTAPAPSASPAQEVPPAAILTIAGSAGVAGSLGTYTFRGTGSDAPWLPGADIVVQRSGPATLELVPPVAVAAWRVKAAAAADPNGLAARTIASGSGAVTFPVDTRSGTVVVEVDFADGIGSAAYFWRLVPG